MEFVNFMTIFLYVTDHGHQDTTLCELPPV